MSRLVLLATLTLQAAPLATMDTCLDNGCEVHEAQCPTSFNHRCPDPYEGPWCRVEEDCDPTFLECRRTIWAPETTQPE